MEAFIGQYDYYILGVILLANGIIWKLKIQIQFSWKLYLPLIILFGLLLPYLSAFLERQKVLEENEMIDGFNLLYLFFRWPTYWLIGFFEFAFLKIRTYYILDIKQSTNEKIS